MLTGTRLSWEIAGAVAKWNLNLLHRWRLLGGAGSGPQACHEIAASPIVHAGKRVSLCTCITSFQNAEFLLINVH